MKRRTKAFAIKIIRIFESLPQKGAAIVLGRQLLRSGTSAGANYRSACRAKSIADFVAKMGIVEEEIDETNAVNLAGTPCLLHLDGFQVEVAVAPVQWLF